MKSLEAFFYQKKIIVTGGTGFIGSNLVRTLLSYSAKVHLFVRKDSNLSRVEDILNDLTVIEVEPSIISSVQMEIKKISPEYFFHFAIPPHNKLRNPQEFVEQLKQSSLYLTNILQSISEISEFKAFIHACSANIYRWSEGRSLDESTPFDPTNFRGMLKLNERNICKYFSRNGKFPIYLARISRAYGPWDSEDKFILTALNAVKNDSILLLGNEKYKRDYIYTEDLIRGVLLLASSKLPSGTEMNLGSSSQYNVLAIVNILEEILGLEIPKKLNAYPKNVYDKGDFLIDNNFAKKTLNWEPEFSLYEGLKATIEWHKNFNKW